jgi:hypothetical protein
MDERPYWTVDPPEAEPPEADTPLRTRGRAHTRPPWWRKPAVTAAAGIVLAGAGVAVGVALTSHAPDSSTDTSPQTHVWGSIAITGFNFTDTQNPTDSHTGDACKTTSGYDDITEGAAVVIGGPTGQIGVGALSGGSISNGNSACSFSFDVAVPSGLSVYTVTISHRGTQTFTPDQLTGGVRLSLGD